jgi:putative transposase
VKFAFVRAEKANHSIKAMCSLLEVTRQGYYAWLNRPPSARVDADAQLCEAIREVFDATKRSYGSPRMLRALRSQGLEVSKRRVERAMRGMGITPPIRRRHCRTTINDASAVPASNELARDFTAKRPNERWVTDITYVWTSGGWAYVAVILDLFSRAVVGWAIDTTLETTLVLRALESAIMRRRPDAGLLHHSDRGCQYTSSNYRSRLAELGVTVSMSRKGNCWDNAVAESFFATLKKELIHRQSWTTPLEVRAAVFEYIEVFYNRDRLHSFLDYKTPAQFEEDFEAAA